jgi:beta-phosphoglucomutase-like phosphatase (HAD superfamily)
MPEAILFDLDGVIVDSEPKHIAAFDEIFLEILGGRPHGMDLHSYIGRSDQAVWTDFIAITNSLPAERLREAHHIVQTYDEVAALLGVAS